MPKGECARLRENVPQVKVHRYNPKHLCPKLNGTEIMAREKCGLLAVPRTVPVSSDLLPVHCACLSFSLQPGQALSRCDFVVNGCQCCYSQLWGVVKMPFVFSHMEYCDMHCVYGFCDGNARAAVDEYRKRFPDWSILSRGVVSHIHQTMCETGCLPSVAVQSEREVVPLIIT